MVRKDDLQSYEKLKASLNEYEKHFSADDNKNFHTLARNFCIQQYSLGNESYLKEAFNCFKHDLKKSYLYHNGGILPSTMQAIVKIGLRNNELDWVKRFLKNHQNKIIGTSEPDSVFNYNMAEYYFAIQEYEKCLDLIEDNLTDLHYKTSAKRLVIKALYETKSTILDSRLNAFKIYIFRISNDTFTPIHKEGNNQFIDILKQIINPATLSNVKRKKSIESKIITGKSVADRQWLLDKLKET